MSDQEHDQAHSDLWGEEEENSTGNAQSKKPLFRISNPIRIEQRRSIILTFALVFISIFAFALIPLLGGGDDDAAEVSATETSIKEIPDEDPSKKPLFGEDAPEVVEIKAARKEAFDQAAETGKSAIKGVSFFNDAQRQQDAALEEAEPEEQDVLTFGLQHGQQTIHDSRRYGNTQQQQKPKPYDFEAMVARAKIDTASWGDQIAKMAAVVAKPSYGGDSSSRNSEGPTAEAPGKTDLGGDSLQVVQDKSAPADAPPEPGAYYNVVPTEVHWLELISQINTDEPGVLAEAISGPLAGARFTGQAVVTPAKRIGIEFTQMVFRDQVLSIQAIVLDPVSLQHSVEGDVDSHYFERYVPFIFAKFAEGYADSLVGTTTTNFESGGSVREDNAIEDAGKRMQYALGTTLEGLLPTWEAQLGRKPTGHYPKGSMLMTMFLSPASIN